jgi:hypothetical protein
LRNIIRKIEEKHYFRIYCEELVKIDVILHKEYRNFLHPHGENFMTVAKAKENMMNLTIYRF